MKSITQSDYFQLAEAMFEAVETAADLAGLDSRRDGAVITLELDNKEKIIINLQAPRQELWLASRSGAYHFSYVEREWLDTRSRHRFQTLLQQAVTAQGGPDLQLS